MLKLHTTPLELMKSFQILSTAVHEDGYELSLTVNFALRGKSDPLVGQKMGLSHGDFLSTYTQGRKASISSITSHDSLSTLLFEISCSSRKIICHTRTAIRNIKCICHIFNNHDFTSISSSVCITNLYMNTVTVSGSIFHTRPV